MIQDDGFFVIDISKNGGGLTFRWTEKLKQLLTRIVELSAPESEFLFTSKTGEPHNASSFKSAWQRAMKKATSNTLEKPFAERYLRNKAVTDAKDLEVASKTVGHTNPLVTKLHYCTLADVVNPFSSKA